ncbi:MAG: signal peptide peptidase SppA [Desulfosarcina sp.]|nr:signal peptide peptidase SppA [Desulfobacterales bacterium]
MNWRRSLAVLLIFGFVTAGCAAPKIRLFTDGTVPYDEYTLEGTGKDKILMVPIEGKISEAPSRGWLRDRPGLVQNVVAQLRKAEADQRIKALVLKINSPGGSVTASDILYHELKAYQARTQVKIIAVFMGLAASGGYYAALPADRIVAHPTSITGSVGVIFVGHRIDGLMEKIGMAVDVNKSGQNKDTGSPFRPRTREETALIQDLTDQLGQRFFDLVMAHRRLTPGALEEVQTARIFLAPRALELGLVDEIGYVSDALEAARREAGLNADARVVVYRRNEYPDDTVYNTAAAGGGTARPALVDLGLPTGMLEARGGFYYLWTPAAVE